ncbi:MAG TPA: bifunctional DNA primase/polymerase, partial [Pseudonocardia sp.]|nr:bifunctional DNA primase/polymerase [Pseudonocardia sp.]
MLEIALGYAAGGAAVLPLHAPVGGACSCMTRGCAHPGKHPRVLGGKDAATTDPEIIERWWRMWPAANLGIRPAPGLVVLDVDPRHGGDAQLSSMQRRYGRLPATRTARTGSGGEHRWFAHAG